jgi:hypothetical protein
VRIPSLVFAASAALLAACARPLPPTITPEKVAVTRIDAAGIALDLTMSAMNPNSVDLTAADVTSHVVVDKTHDVGTVTLPKTLTLPAGKTTSIDVPVTLRWSDMGVLGALAASQGAVPYSVDGTLEMGGSLLHVGVPFHLDGAITRDQIAGAVLHALPFGQ